MDTAVDLVRRSLSRETRERFDRRVDEQAARLMDRIARGDLDNADPAIGLEVECYLVDDENRLVPLPEGAIGDAPVSPELGKHNVEINTPAAVFDDAGIRAQVDALEARLAAATVIADSFGAQVVLDGMWTIPPEGGTTSYLGGARADDGVIRADNMTESPRYYAIDNHVLDRVDGTIEFDVPGAHVTAPSILIESLTSSIQPHLQIPNVGDFVAAYNTAIRTLGPVLAVSTNSPFLPSDLYEERDADTVLAETVHELRVPVFERALNVWDGPGKVRFPGDIAQPEDIVRKLVADRPIAPFLREWVDGDAAGEFTDTFWELDHKHGTYWRWLRAVMGGDLIDDDNDERSLRLEYRPLPTQPSIDDIVGLQCLVTGLIHGLLHSDHPLQELDWDDAKRSFYNAVADGPRADLRWMTADGTVVDDPDRIYPELFAVARRGLRDRGVTDRTIERYLAPIERRWEARTTPSVWKLATVRDGLAEGLDLPEAIHRMQSAYIDRCGTPFVEWIG